jgi:hypothetical protein
VVDAHRAPPRAGPKGRNHKNYQGRINAALEPDHSAKQTCAAPTLRLRDATACNSFGSKVTTIDEAQFTGTTRIGDLMRQLSTVTGVPICDD